MKLNLVPTNVSKERSSGGAIMGFVVLVIIGIVACVAMVVISGARLQKSREAEADALQRAANTKAISDRADALMATKDVNTLVRDVNLAQAMSDHSAVYPDLYDMVRNYIPSYYRVTSMVAAPGDANSCTVTLSGVLTTYQQYADLGLALMRMPGATSYSPSAYQITDKYIPPLTPEDMHGRAIRPGEPTIPDDPLQRMDQDILEGHLTGYLGDGYGDAGTTLKGPMPNASQVTITITLTSDPKRHFSADLMTPDPRATLAAAASTSSTSTLAAGASSGFGPPGATAGSAPPASSPPAATKGKKGKGTGDDE